MNARSGIQAKLRFKAIQAHAAQSRQKSAGKRSCTIFKLCGESGERQPKKM